MGELSQYQEEQHKEGLVATKYVLGDAETDGHNHWFFLRDDLPVATTAGYLNVNSTETNHVHAIKAGPGDTVIVEEVHGHTHTALKVEEAGDYKARTIFAG